MPSGGKTTLRATPRFCWQTTLKGTRIPVGLVLGYLAAGKTAEETLSRIPRSHAATKSPHAWTMRRELAEFEAVV